MLEIFGSETKIFYKSHNVILARIEKGGSNICIVNHRENILGSEIYQQNTN